jgi:hypothetical protein
MNKLGKEAESQKLLFPITSFIQACLPSLFIEGATSLVRLKGNGLDL